MQTYSDEQEIRNVLLSYTRGADRKDWALMADAYHEDAFDDHGAFKGGVKDFVEWVRKRHETIDQSMHFLGNCLIEIEGDVAFVETYCTIYQHERTGKNTFGTTIPNYKRTTIGFRYVDRFERRAGVWKIAHRILVFEWIKEDLVNFNFDPSWSIAQRSREDAIYKIRAIERSPS